MVADEIALLYVTKSPSLQQIILTAQCQYSNFETGSAQNSLDPTDI